MTKRPRQQVKPEDIICEILGQPAPTMRNPVNADYRCPFRNSICTKSSQRIEGPYPVCTIFYAGKPICVCPKRFYEEELVRDILKVVWPHKMQANYQHAHEVQLKNFGKVDFVIADIDSESGSFVDFISVEIQGIDITGSVEPAYTALINNAPSIERPTYGLNWMNVLKRFITQLITKGYFHHHWQSKIVCILQTPIYDSIKKTLGFSELSVEEGNIVFMLYDYVVDEERGPGFLKLKFTRALGTKHSDLMTGILYQTPPDREEYCKRILRRLK